MNSAISVVCMGRYHTYMMYIVMRTCIIRWSVAAVLVLIDYCVRIRVIILFIAFIYLGERRANERSII